MLIFRRLVSSGTPTSICLPPYSPCTLAEEDEAMGDARNHVKVGEIVREYVIDIERARSTNYPRSVVIRRDSATQYACKPSVAASRKLIMGPGGAKRTPKTWHVQ